MQKRLPALLGILFMVGGAFAGVIIVLQGTFFSPQASPETVPQKVKITNLTENSFVVSWTTQGQAVGYILLGEDEKQLKRSVADQRDQLSGEGGQYKMHHIYVRELRPSTTYYFKIGSGERELFDNNGVPFTVQTAAVLGTPPPPETIYGTVLTPAKTAADDTIVYVGIPGSTPLSALVQQKGSFAIPLSTARTLTLDSYVSIDPSTTIEMLVQSGRGEESRVRAKLSQAQPLPDIVLSSSGQVVDISGQAPASDDADSTSSRGDIPSSPGYDPLSRVMTGTTTGESKFVFENVSLLVEEASEVISIEQLPADHVTIPSLQPNFSGQAPPNTTLTVTINSPRAYVDTVSADDLGNWSYEVPGELEPGPHTISISYTDENGILKQVKRTFIVSAYASEGTPSYISTPSASLAPSITPRPTTSQITQAPSPTTTVRAALPATDSAIPVSGSVANTFALSLGGLMLMSLGYFLYRYGKV
jgi:hypothetical protein